jgi:hypothetical protein
MIFNLKCAIPVAITMLAAGCSQVADSSAPPTGSAFLQDGYRAGCQSGKAEANVDMDMPGYEQDSSKYASNVDYRSGWDLGYRRCYDDYSEHTPMISGY